MKAGAARYSLAYFFLFSIYGVVSPYLQIILSKLGYGPALVGLFLSLFEIVGIFGPLAISRLADATGKRKPALAFSGLAILVALPSLVLVPRPLVTGLSIVVFAVGVKTIVPLMDSATLAFVSSARAGGRTAKGGYGSVRVMGSVGFIATALALQLIPGFGGSPAWAIALCVAATTLVFLASLLALPIDAAMHPPPPAAGARAATADAPGATASAGRMAAPAFALGLVVIGLSRLAMTPVNAFLSLYATDGLHLEAVGGLWALAAASEVPLMLLATAIISRTGAMGAIAIASSAVVVRLGVMAAFPGAASLVATQLLHSLCYGLFQPAAVAFVAECVPPARRSTGMALYMGLGMGLPAVIGSAMGGFVVEAWGYRVLFASFIVFALASLALWAAFRKRFAPGSRT